MMDAMASLHASSGTSRVRAARVRRIVFAWLQHNSIGERAGEEAGKERSVAGAASIASRLPATLWALRLSIITTLPGRRWGTRAWVT